MVAREFLEIVNRIESGAVQAPYRTMKRTVACFIGIGLFGGTVCGQEKEVDPFNDKDWQKAKMIDDAPENWEVMWEVFSVPFADAAKLRREVKDAGKIYELLVKRVEEKKAGLEEFVVLKGSVWKTSEAGSYEEYIYSTESEPPELPNVVKKVPENPEVVDLLMTPAMPSAFDTRNVGRSLEIVIEEKVSPDVIRVALKFDRVSLVELVSWGQKKSELKMPKFSSHGVKKEMLLKNGKTTLVGTMSPTRKGRDEKGDRRVWLAFATASAGEK
jgi:hypothetical protein